MQILLDASMEENILVDVFMLDEVAISWKSVKQTLIASSIMESEFIEALNQAIWLHNFITGLQIVNGLYNNREFYLWKV